jgi:hypothetical protein
VNPGGWLGVVFDLDGKTFTDVITAMSLGLENPWSEDSLRIGIRVQGFL